MMQPGADGVAEQQPQTMQFVQVFRPQTRGVRAEVDIRRRAARTDDFERERVTRLRQLFPSEADTAREFVRRHVGRSARHEARNLQVVCRLHHRVERVDGGNNQQFDRLSFLLRNGDDSRKEFLLVFAKNLIVLKRIFAVYSELSNCHDDDVVAAEVGFLKGAPQGLHLSWVSNGNQNTTGSRMEEARIHARLGLEVEFLERVFVSAETLLERRALLIDQPVFPSVDVLRSREEDEKGNGESDAVDGCVAFRKQVGKGGGKQQQSGGGEAHGKNYATDADIARHFVFLVVPLEAENKHAQTFQCEAPDHAKGVRFTQQVNIAPAQDDGRHLQERY